ncbi:hypothetical protein VTG60DRAFT_1726 [Thermothelomyces hinnuleus]
MCPERERGRHHGHRALRYDASSTADPETESTVTPSDSCLGEPPAKTVPYLSLDVTNMRGGVVYENLNSTLATQTDYFKWTINTRSLVLDWSDPTMGQIMRGESLFPTEYNVVPVEASGTGPE